MNEGIKFKDFKENIIWILENKYEEANRKINRNKLIS